MSTFEPFISRQPHRHVSGECPVCSGTMHITRLECDACGSSLEGHFLLHALTRMSPEQLSFLESFIRNRGVIKDVEVDLGISYPTVKARLEDVVRTMGYTRTEGDLRPSKLRDERRSILDRLQKREISSDEASQLLAALTERKDG